MKKTSNRSDILLLALAKQAARHAKPSSVESILMEELVDRLESDDGKAPSTPVEHIDINDGTDWTKVKRVCPHCGKTKSVVSGFGFAKKRGNTVPQSWCRVCRAEENYHSKPRQYKTSAPSNRR